MVVFFSLQCYSTTAIFFLSVLGSVCFDVKRFRKMFSSFAGVCFTVKSKSTGKHLLLTGKLLRKIRKTVYGKIFRKPFSKTRVMLLSLISRLSLSLLSLFLTVSALFLLCPARPSHPLPSQPEPPSATPCLALLPLFFV
jgi:hypothetical protein